ncbi:ABC transporter permease [Frateuria defendens]|uniref:ABC transporter permease n=1 Tax=Frateuria defendens TaxID=2219559 RepID=UPI00066FF782|nr:ABC transporter permease [Frateuria defendens]
MRMHPILAALRRHKSGVALIALQIALTLAIVCNAVFIIGQRIERLNRPTGVDEDNLFVITQRYVGAPSGDDAASLEKLDAMERTDLDALRRLPDVASVAYASALPLSDGMWTGGIGLKPAQQDESAHAAYFAVDERALDTLGLRLVAGRAFTAADIEHHGMRGERKPAIVIVTKALADKLFPQGDAVGKTVYLDDDSTPSTIVGVVERLQISGGHNHAAWADTFAWNSVLEPLRIDFAYARYAVRAKPGRLAEAMRAVAPALYAVNPMRVLDDEASVQSFADIRADAYQADRGMAILMGIVCLILLAVTAAGIVGLTSFWVGQRHRQIGVRRALGARRGDILRYFQAENLMIAVFGSFAGVLLALGLNLWLMRHYEMARLPVAYVLSGLLLVLLLGQCAVLGPARRAARIPPIVATRAA